MGKDKTLKQFLSMLASCSGDEAIEIVSRFQDGSLTVEGISVEEVEDE